MHALTDADSPDPAETHLQELENTWECLAKDDPLWAILSQPDKTSRKWNVEEFFGTGEEDIAGLFRTLQREQIPITPMAAVDFGCGVGRLTQALASRFDCVYGIDVSQEMIRLANEFNRRPEKCRYICNVDSSLAVLEHQSVSFIYSTIVLQHIPPPLCAKYLQEFVRVLNPGGLLVFQLPSYLRARRQNPGPWCKARLDTGKTDFRVASGTRFTVQVSVTNSGSGTWFFDPLHLYAVGNHWLNQGGSVVRYDDGRAIIPHNVASSDSIDISLEVNAPEDPGDYLLEIDVVQEGVTWFAQQGSSTLRIPVHVGAAPAQSAQLLSDAVAAVPASTTKPMFAMYAINRGEVIALLDRCGAFLEYIEHSEAAPGFHGYRYYFRKRE